MCHCGGVEIEVSLPNGLNKLIRCNCSICKRRGAVMAMVGPNDLKVIKGNFILKLRSIIFVLCVECILTTIQEETQVHMDLMWAV